MIKGFTYIRIGLIFSLYSLTKTNREKIIGNRKYIMLQTGKEVIHQSLSLVEINVRDRTDITS